MTKKTQKRVGSNALDSIFEGNNSKSKAVEAPAEKHVATSSNPREGYERYAFIMKTDLIKKLKTKAHEERRTVIDVVQEIFEAYFKKHPVEVTEENPKVKLGRPLKF